MERLRVYLPWIAVWLPAPAVIAGMGTMGVLKLLHERPPSFPSLVGEIPRTSLVSLEEQAPKVISQSYDIAKTTPFTADEPKETAKTSELQIEPNHKQLIKEKIRLSGVFTVNGSKICLINGMIYREGSSIYERGVISYIGLNNIVIRVGNEEKTIMVGQETEI